VIYAAFDLLWLDGKDASKRPLVERKGLLHKLLPKNHHALLYVQHFDSPGAKVFKQVRAMDFEASWVSKKTTDRLCFGWPTRRAAGPMSGIANP
jgi:bifunctional non-homologous end joining protein LigD